MNRSPLLRSGDEPVRAGIAGPRRASPSAASCVGWSRRGGRAFHGDKFTERQRPGNVACDGRPYHRSVACALVSGWLIPSLARRGRRAMTSYSRPAPTGEAR